MLLIVATPRSGSSALLEACALHPDVRAVFEPFRAPSAMWHDKAGLFYDVFRTQGKEAALAAVEEQYNCVKCVLGSHQPSLRFCLRWASSPDVRVVGITRRNVLRQAVSAAMSAQSRVWQPWSDAGVVRVPGAPYGIERRGAHRKHEFEPLSLLAVGADVGRLRRKGSALRARLAKMPNAMTLTYEDVFDGPAELQVDAARAILSHGGFDPSKLDAAEPRRRLAELLAISRMNDTDTYRRVPGIEQIESELGSPEHGYLFRDA